MNYNEHVLEYFVLLGKHIQEMREERGLKIEDVALKTGIRKEYLRKIELGKAYGVAMERHLFKIAKVFKVTMKEFFNI